MRSKSFSGKRPRALRVRNLREAYETTLRSPEKKTGRATSVARASRGSIRERRGWETCEKRTRRRFEVRRKRPDVLQVWQGRTYRKGLSWKGSEEVRSVDSLVSRVDSPATYGGQTRSVILGSNCLMAGRALRRAKLLVIAVRTIWTADICQGLVRYAWTRVKHDCSVGFATWPRGLAGRILWIQGRKPRRGLVEWGQKWRYWGPRKMRRLLAGIAWDSRLS
jgi:hypothetical protein